MLGDFYFPRLSNDMKIVGHKNHLPGQIWYKSLGPSKKRRQNYFSSSILIGRGQIHSGQTHGIPEGDFCICRIAN